MHLRCTADRMKWALPKPLTQSERSPILIAVDQSLMTGHAGKA
jgi:hypothetical protein